MNGLANLEFGHVHFQVLGQVFGQAPYLYLDQQMSNDAAGLHTRAAFLIGEVQRHSHGDLLGVAHPLEIHVRNIRRHRVALHGFQYRLRAVLADVDPQDVGRECLVCEVLS